MSFQILKELILLVEQFDSPAHRKSYTNDLSGFKRWIWDNESNSFSPAGEPYWNGKENGRSPESIINTLLIHMSRYAKSYSRSAIHDSKFATQEDFIYLINLKSLGAMTKMELIRKNIQDKPTGMQIINRLIKNGWLIQQDSEIDKRSKVISITPQGLETLDKQMDKIRLASQVVTGNLSHGEKMELIRILSKLNDFHNPIFQQNMPSSELLVRVNENYMVP